MNKTELAAVVAEKTEVSKVDAERAVTAVVEAVTEALQSGEKVSLAGFGAFQVKDRAARQGRNPQTGEPLEIKASKSASFKAGKALKDSLNA
jgi:DNA-binding protein HU-beta